LVKEDYMKAYSANRTATIIVAVTLLLLAGQPAVQAESPRVIEVGRFSAERTDDELPAGWAPFTFKGIDRNTDYRLVEEDGKVVVKATAHASASGLMRRIAIDPREYPIVQWRWKAASVLEKADIHRKEGDDYPARIYIAFEYDPDKLGLSDRIKYGIAKVLHGEYPPHAVINYLWASKAPMGLVVPNAYTERSMMIVVQSGAENLNAWVEEERNILEDYRKAFHEEPPMISGVAIMTDTDNTEESATAYYGDILFRKENP
jgi:hypothetical protein